MNFAKLIIKECLHQGITHFCFAPGSRSAPLVVAISKEKKAHTHIHFDERGVAFLALGLAKSAKKPVVIITTSGSAVGNLLPAIMEANAAHVPLILLTADRPFELRECGANQTCDQVKIFEPFIRYQVDLPASDTHLSPKLVHQTIAHAIYRAHHLIPGPVQVNCQFREPFLPLKACAAHTSIHYTISIPTPSERELKTWAQALASAKRGVILAGADAFASNIVALAKKLKWPLLTDPLSQIRCASSVHIPYFNHISLPSTDCVLHFGDRFVSKDLLQWLGKEKPPFYGLVAEHPFRHDPLHLLTHRMTISVEHFCKTLIPLLPAKRNTGWLKTWQDKSREAKKQIDSFFAKEKKLSEPGLFHFLQNTLPTSWSLFLANSMPIRDTDFFFFPSKPQTLVMANRGVSGIDGNIATAIGMSKATDAPLLAILGDLSALHDLNSFALLKQTKRPVILLIINNQGGGIFSFLPIAKEEATIFETHFAVAHDHTFQHVAALFSIAYLHLTTKDALEKTLFELFNKPKTCLIEVHTNRKENHSLHQCLHKVCAQN